MKRISIIFLQAVLILISIVVLSFLIIMPSKEGRATNLDLISIYTDPFILYGYAASIAFFVALYKAFRLLGYIEKNKVFSIHAVKALNDIKYSAIILTTLIVIGGVFIHFTHDKKDDPAGFFAICFVTSFASIVVATAAAIFGKLLQSAVDMKSESELTV